MNYLPFPKAHNLSLEVVSQLNNAAAKLHFKLNTLNLDQLEISSYNKKYLQSYINSLDFYLPVYTQLMAKALKQLSKPIEESTFIDYGGGCGLLSFFVRQLGFKNVIYSDIYDVSVKDVKL
ncbi:MAG: hypothetical protein ACK40G_07950 [Cytophagaceae bacterium]